MQNLLAKNLDNVESDNKYDDNSAMPPLICEEEIDVMSSGDESDHELFLRGCQKTFVTVFSLIRT